MCRSFEFFLTISFASAMASCTPTATPPVPPPSNRVLGNDPDPDDIATHTPPKTNLQMASSDEPVQVAAPSSSVTHGDPRPPLAANLKVRLPACTIPTGVFFSDVQNGTISRIDLKTRQVRTITTAMADDLALDTKAQQLYFTSEDKWIGRVSTEGKNVEQLLGQLPNPYCLALDLVHHRIFWTNQTEQPRIQNAATSGKGLTTVVKGSGCCTIGIAIDLEDHRVYWTDGYYKGRVMRADLSGTYEQQIGTTVGIANGIDVDAAAGKVYWTEYGNGRQDDVVRRANLDGSQVETLLTSAQSMSTPQHIAVDHAGGHFYLTDLHAGRVLRAKLDGSQPETLWQGSGFPRAITLDRPEPCR